MTDGTDPVSRAVFLESLKDEPAAEDNSDGGRLFRQIDRAEQAVTRAEEDLFQARGQARNARDNCPEAGLTGDLSPGARSRFLAWREAEHAELEAERSWNAARAALDRLLGEYEAISQPSLGLPPGPLGDPGEGDDGSLAYAERQAEKARRDRRHHGPARGFALD